MTVSNMIGNSGVPVKNQFIISDENSITFKSYESNIVRIDYNTKITYLDKNFYDFSNTTRKYRNLFLNIDSKQFKENLKNGLYQLVDLNKKGNS